MPNDGNTDYRRAAELTISLTNHSHAPDRITNAILETLIEMAGELNVSIWQPDSGLSLDGLTQLYSRQEAFGGGQRRARLYGNYELGRRERLGIGDDENNK